MIDLLNVRNYNLRNLGRKNILLGKNGCGKSQLLRTVETGKRNTADVGALKYLSPERGGTLEYDPGVEQSLSKNVDWLSNQRRRNQADGFRQQSAAQFSRLERLVLREIEQVERLRLDTAFTTNCSRSTALFT